MHKKLFILLLSLISIFTIMQTDTSFASGGWEVMASGTTQNLNSISGLSTNIIYAVGASGTILKYDGSTWSSQESGTTWNLNNVWAVMTNNIYAVGEYRGIFRSDGSTWNKIHSQATNYPLYGIGGPDSDNGKMIAVGKNNTIWVLFVPQYYNILDGNESSFRSQEQHEYSRDLYGTFFTASDQNVTIVGSKGFIGYYNGYDYWGHNDMNKYSSPVSSTLRGVWGIDSNNMFVVGDSGVIIRRENGGSWATMTSNTTVNLRAVWGTSMTNVYAVGENGTVMYFNGTAWSQITVPTTQQLNGIWGISANEIYAVGNGGTILRYIGSQDCYCPNGSMSVQYRKADNSGWEKCQCTYYATWCDPTTNICWQDPQKDPYPLSYLDGGDPGVASQDAVRYCDEIVALGYDDWRLPNINELRSLIRGNTDTMTGGDCPLVPGASFETGQDSACLGATDAGGPGIEGCYWPAELTGSCHRPDIGTQGVHSLEFWATDIASNRPDWVASVLFDIAGVCYNHINSYGDVRCIRDAPTTPVTCVESETCTPNTTRQCTASNGKTGAQVCNASGDCWGPCESTAFTPTPRPTDVCDQCDQLVVTIRVPEQLTTTPAQLMAFFYKAESWTFPPQGPPDGGTDYNLVQNPDINIDKPYVMTVPGCTYYRESCLAGQFQLYVGLYYSTAWPPLPADGDYVWGKDQPAITLGDGPQETLTMDITLDKCENGECEVQVCTDPAKPYECSNGECRADASECCDPGEVRCSDDQCYTTCPTCGTDSPVPNDDTVWGCRFSNNYSSDSCADFPECEGWPNDQAAIQAACLATGSGAANCVCTRGNSCQVERAMSSDTTRCTFTQDSKKYYAFGMPSIGCTFGGGSDFMNSPICTEYCE